MKTFQILMAFTFLIVGTKSFSNEVPPETVSHVDLGRYMGTWYEIARFPFKQQEGCFNTTANYFLNSDNTLKVTNSCRKGGPDRKYLWILSRTPVMEESLYIDLLRDLKADHFNVESLEKTPQDRGAL